MNITLPDRGPLFTPVGRTSNGIEPFNFRFKDNRESFSFYLGTWAKTDTFRDIAASGDKQRLQFWACHLVGRGFDWARCCAVAIRPVNEDFECRLSFSAPWWYAAVLEAASREPQ